LPFVGNAAPDNSFNPPTISLPFINNLPAWGRLFGRVGRRVNPNVGGLLNTFMDIIRREVEG
jgi:hypothetical protein